MSEIKKFEYDEQVIEFDLQGDNVMVNATEMAKVFDKRVDVFLKTDHVNAFMKVLEFTPYGGNSEPLKKEEIIKTRGKSGTWMHRILAIKFAAWLNPEFELWVYSTIDHLLFGEYREIQKSLKETAEIKNKIEKLEEKLQQSDEYQELERLKLHEKQLRARRANYNKHQLQLFRQ